MDFVNVVTTLGSPVITVNTNSQVGGRPLQPDMYISIPGAFPTPTRILSVLNFDATMESNALTNETAGEVTYHPDFFGEILSGERTTTIVVPTGDMVAITNRPCMHADPGVLIRAWMARVEDCTVHDFQGNGIHVEAAVGSVPYSNANLWQLQNCQVRNGGGGGSLNGLYIHAADTNTANIIGCDFGGSERGWAVLDLCFLGNTYVDVHTDGGNAFCFRQTTAQTTTMVGCYSEGSYCKTGLGTLVVGGAVPNTAGGRISTRTTAWWRSTVSRSAAAWRTPTPSRIQKEGSGSTP